MRCLLVLEFVCKEISILSVCPVFDVSVACADRLTGTSRVVLGLRLAGDVGVHVSPVPRVSLLLLRLLRHARFPEGLRLCFRPGDGDDTEDARSLLAAK